MKQETVPLVSVIIPTYNRARVVPEAIESVLGQTYANIETIVVDDGSTDDTWLTVGPYLSEIRYFLKENGGESSARNFGLARVQGDYVAFLDSDDSWRKDKIEKQMRKLVSGEYAVCITDAEVIDDEGRFIRRTNLRKTIVRDGFILKYYLRNTRIGCSSTMLAKKKAIEEVGLFDETLITAQDQEYFMRLASRFRAALVAEPLAVVRKSRDSVSRKICTGNSIAVLDRLVRIAPEFVRKNGPLIRETKARINLGYAEDLLWHRYLSEARSRLRESLSMKLTLKALALYAKSALLDALSHRFPQYRDRGCFHG